MSLKNAFKKQFKKTGNYCCRLVIFSLLAMSVKAQTTPAYLNAGISIERRVSNLVSMMTLEEKVSQMQNNAPAIKRLNIPGYNWWNEGLHGVGRSGIATVFPQAIGMAATFNDSLLGVEATAISDEFRAKYNEYQRKNDRDIYKGLTVWSPNINIFRDPRWGRGQETYGEDPWLTSRMGVAFIKGLQGNNPIYLKTVATPKHFVVHSGPESSRHTFNANVSDRDFYETYTPAFEASIREGKAFSLMGAYNRFRGKSCSGSDTLLTDLLRTKWGFKGYVVSDCGAISDIYASHKIVPTPAEAAAIGVKAGCDLECGETYLHLKEAVEKGFITEKEIDVAVKRLFTERFKLGMFDPQNKVPFNKIPISVNDSKKHKDLALTTALQSLVLLKNDNRTLPLRKNISFVAVFGPNANERETMYGNYNGFPSSSVTILEGIKQAVDKNTKVLYNIATNLAGDEPFVSLVADCFENGVTAEFFNNDSLSGKPVATSNSDFISIKWDNGPVKGIGRDHYSVRWAATIIAPVSGNYEFLFSGDDGYRFFIDDDKLIDEWRKENLSAKAVHFVMEAGKKYKIKLELNNKMYGCSASLRWKVPGVNPIQESSELAKRSDVSIFVGGLSPTLEGEEMDVKIEGFAGGDRTTLDLPSCQVNFLKQLVAIGKPVVLVLLNGSAVSINWESKNVPAILEAWYPGQAGGTAVAKAIFGDYNPGGKLPVTFYKSVNDIPAFDNYDMEGRTYRYFRGEALYPFGHGLSYTSFKYANLKLSSSTMGKSGMLTVTASVTNTGLRDGDEVVQLYIKDMEASTPRPIRELKAYSRVSLQAGQTKTVRFTIKPSQLKMSNDQQQSVIVPGDFELQLGTSSANILLKKIFTYK